MRVIIAAVLIALVAGAAAGQGFPDRNGDDFIDAADLFIAADVWQASQQNSFDFPQLFDLFEHWHAARPLDVQLRLAVCNAEAIAGDAMVAHLDLVDSAGRNINPGTEGGSSTAAVVLSLNGHARFPDGMQQQLLSLTQPEGLEVTILDDIAEPVVLSAQLAGAPNPVNAGLQFIVGGRIAGTVFTLGQPARTNAVSIVVRDPVTGEIVTTAAPQVFTGNYETPQIRPGIYDVSFEEAVSSVALAPVCIPGVTVSAGLTRGGIGTDMDARLGGVRVAGKITAADGAALVNVTLFMTPQGGTTCGAGAFRTTVFTGGGATELNYELIHIPPGEYVFTGGGASTDALGPGYALPAAGVPVTVGVSDVTANLILMPTVNVDLLGPVAYQRVITPLFTWVPATASAPIDYEITLSNECGVVWRKTGITGSSFAYDGPPLDKGSVYYWTLRGEATGGTLRVFGSNQHPAAFVSG